MKKYTLTKDEEKNKHIRLHTKNNP